MAWALQFDGVDDELSLATPVLIGASDFLERIRFHYNGNSNEVLIANPENNNDVIRITNNTTVLVKLGSNSTNVTLSSSLTVGFHTWRIKRTAGVVDITDDSNTSLLSNVTTNTSSFTLHGFGTIASGGNRFSSQLEFWQHYSDSSATTLVHDWDATASNHGTGQPVLVDTIGNNDATGVNFPTDGSAWFDSGGGGSTDYPTTLESGSITYSGSSINVTQVINTTIASGSLSLTGQPISNPITFNSVLQSGDIALTGQSITVTSILNSTLESGSLLLTGQSITTDYIPAPSETSTILGSGSITLDGQSIQATQQINTLLDSGSISLTGSPMLFGQVTETVLGTGELTLIGDTLTTTVNSGIILETGQLTLNGQPITVTSSNDVIQTIQSVTVNYTPNLITTKYAQDTITARYKD